ncbi:protein kinase family protein [Trifolium repens]|nr:protein kinase family protein [Trifolium repens]
MRRRWNSGEWNSSFNEKEFFRHPDAEKLSHRSMKSIRKFRHKRMTELKVDEAENQFKKKWTAVELETLHDAIDKYRYKIKLIIKDNTYDSGLDEKSVKQIGKRLRKLALEALQNRNGDENSPRGGKSGVNITPANVNIEECKNSIKAVISSKVFVDKVTKDIVTCFFHEDSCDIHLNHADLLGAIWSWTGIKVEHRVKVAELLSMMGSLRPQSSERKSKWVVIRRQLLQELGLDEAMVNRLQTVGLRFCGSADQALPRLRGALPSDKRTFKALDELSELANLLRIWRIDKNVYIDALMAPNESYHRDLFFQVYLRKENSSGSLSEGVLLAVGGRYDNLLHQLRSSDYKGNPPTGMGTSLALETIIQNCPVDFKPSRNEASISILVCSRGGGGLLVERMELVAELWQENFKAEFVPVPDPSLTEQYEYANEHDIKCLVIITDASFSLADTVKVRHLELKKEKNVERENLVKFLSDAMATQFRNPYIWI